MELSLKINYDEVKRRLGSFQDQLPYAMSVMNNELMYRSTDAVRDALPAYFTIRNAFTRQGIVTIKGTKRAPAAEVGFKENRWYMLSQVVGDSNRRNPGGKPDWQPLQTGSKPPRPNPSKPIVPGRRPNVASAAKVNRKGKRQNQSAYFGVTNWPVRGLSSRKSWRVTGNVSHPGIFYREKGESRKFVAAYWLQTSTNIKPRFPMLKIVDGAVARNINRASEKAIRLALTPKPGRV
jgi:hypothetical protein